MCYKVDFNTVIRGYHVYKKVWNSCCTEQVYGKHDTREEALENDKHAIGVYKLNSSTLVGHLMFGNHTWILLSTFIRTIPGWLLCSLAMIRDLYFKSITTHNPIFNGYLTSFLVKR